MITAILYNLMNLTGLYLALIFFVIRRVFGLL
nr:MAG TPA: hypothetical protein [Caudoviricetes sp.]